MIFGEDFCPLTPCLYWSRIGYATLARLFRTLCGSSGMSWTCESEKCSNHRSHFDPQKLLHKLGLPPVSAVEKTDEQGS